MVKQVQLYDDQLDFEENKVQGPFGDYAADFEPYQDKGEPQYDFFGTPVYSPFGIGAGPLPTVKFLRAALDKGFDIVVPKSVRTDAFPLNAFPQVRPVNVTGDLDSSTDTVVTVDEQYRDTLAVANSFGIPSVPPSKWQPYIHEALFLPKKGQVVFPAFQGTARGDGSAAFVADHVKGIGLLRDAGATMVEINLSCPNEGSAVLTCFDLDMTEAIVQAVRVAYPNIIFTIKLAYFSDKSQLKDLVSRVGGIVDGISAINTMPTVVVNESGESVFPGRPKAGISGKPIRWAGLEMTETLAQYRKELGMSYKILSLGGVLGAQDFQDYIDKGADYVFSVSGAMWNPDLAAEVKASL